MNLRDQLRGVVSLMGYAVNTIFWAVPLLIMAVVKAVVPIAAWRRACGRILTAIAENWIWVNNLAQNMTADIRFDVHGLESLKRKGGYLVLSNHQSWVDILVLQRIFYRKIPFLRFFIKKELFWFPVLGQAWWALDYPFIKRYRRSVLEKNPHLRGKDLEITRKACEKFKQIPVSIMNFVEGTRFTAEKHNLQKSPYAHLLKPKAGGTAFVLGAMGDQIHRILDVTIVYPGEQRSFWALLCGRIQEVKVRIQSFPVTPELIGDYSNDHLFRERLQQWLNDLWREKDRRITEMLATSWSSPLKRPG